MRKAIRCLAAAILVIAAVGFPVFAGSGDNIFVQLRLYKGFKKKGRVSAVTVSSYYLKQFTEDKLLSDLQIDKEKNSLKKIYNLEAVENISIFNMVLKQGGENSQAIVLGERQLTIKLSTTARDKNRFKIEVREKGKTTPLLETELIIPQEKTAVLGFEDAEGRIFFFSFHREKDASEAKAVATIEKPWMLKMVKPVYPEEALEKGIEGDVEIRAVINEQGNLTRLKVEQGVHPLLDRAALDAVKQWKYKPLKTNGIPRPMEVSVKITFRVKESHKGPVAKPGKN